MYESTPLYDRHSLTGLESDVRTVAEAWFGHDAHTSVEQFVCSLPVAYFQFHTHDRYEGSTRYEMDTLFRVFLLKELHRWEHETALVDYLDHRSDLCVQLGLERVPDQSTLWRSWNKRFTADLRETVEAAARTVLIKAQNEGVNVPREPERKLQHRLDDSNEPEPDDETVLEQAEKLTDHVRRVVFPRSRWNVVRAVRYTRTRTGTYRRISDYVRASLPTRVLGASSTSRLENGRHSVTPIANAFETSPSSGFGKCIDRLSVDC